MRVLVLVAVFGLLLGSIEACTVTTASGTHAPSGFCSGALIFEDNFNSLDQSRWLHAGTMSGGGNEEFQWYVNDRANSYTTGGNLHIKPTFTSDIFGEDFLYNGRAVIPEWECTEYWNFGCDRTGGVDHIINPIRSARIDSSRSFSFKYGTLEIRAKMPLGDWLWPALWMMPKDSVYGQWPRSGEIDLMEARGNHALFSNGGHVGIEQTASTMHFGPQAGINGFNTAHFYRNQIPGFDSNFHVYRLVWTPLQIEFFVDNVSLGIVHSGNGFWERGGFASSGLANPWAGASVMAPFDQEFFIIINNAVGGTNYFDDSFDNRNGGKPWSNASPPGRARGDFWNGRGQWESSWNRHNDQSHLQVDYVRVWAL